MANELVIYTGNEVNDTLVFEVGQTDTLIWGNIQYTIVSGIDLCDLTGTNSAINLIGVTPAVDLVGEMFSVFIDTVFLRFDGIGVLFNGQFTAVKSVANLIGFYSWLNGNSQQIENLIETDKGEFIATSSKLEFEVNGEGQKVDVFSEPHEC